jgi:hypothetical protein
MASSPHLVNETGPVPPALPPRDPASPPNNPADPAPGVTPTSGRGLDVEIDLLRSTVRALRDELAGLHRAMASRAVIDQAKGALRAVSGASSDEAFALLAARSQNANRKLSVIATAVLAALEPTAATERAEALLAAVRHPEVRGLPETRPVTWRTRHRWDALSSAVGDRDQLLALAHLGERLAGARDEDDVLHLILHDGAEALGAYAAAVSRIEVPGSVSTSVGRPVDDNGPEVDRPDDERPVGDSAGGVGPASALATMPLDATHPATECIRSGRAQVLSRADLALTYPRYPRPDRLRCLVVLPLATATDRPAAWSLFFDKVASVDRGTRAMLDRAARMVTSALLRTPSSVADEVMNEE